MTEEDKRSDSIKSSEKESEDKFDVKPDPSTNKLLNSLHRVRQMMSDMKGYEEEHDPSSKNTKYTKGYLQKIIQWTKLNERGDTAKKLHLSLALEKLKNANGQKTKACRSKIEPQQDFTQDENVTRGNWTNKFDFFIVGIGYIISTGNLSTFPAKCQQYGGVIYVIPYVVCMILLGIPVLFLEMSLGQFTSSGFLTCWEFSRICRGIGYAMLLANFLFVMYYNVTIAKALVYVAAALEHVNDYLPWDYCHSKFNTEFCVRPVSLEEQGWFSNCSAPGFIRMENNGTCYNLTTWRFHSVYNQSAAKLNGIDSNWSTEEYYKIFLLGTDQKTGIESLGSLKWQIAVAYLIVWLIICVGFVRGFKLMAKIQYFLVFFPMLIIIILLGRAITLDKPSFEGMRDYLILVDWNKLADLETWVAAGTHVLFSMGLGMGVFIALASTNRFHYNHMRDAVLFALIDIIYNLVCGFLVYAFIHNLSDITGKELEHDTGDELLFLLYPEALARISDPHVWAVMYFLMVACLGLSTSFASFQGMLMSITDRHQVLWNHQMLLVFGICALSGVIGLIYCTEAGIYVIHFVSYYMGNFNSLFLVFTELIAIAWFYGTSKYWKDICIMFGYSAESKIRNWLCFCWCFLSPAALLLMMIFAWVKLKPLSLDDYVYPDWTKFVGWVGATSFIIFILVSIIKSLRRTKGPLAQRLVIIRKPTEFWGPALRKHRVYLSDDPDFVIDPWAMKAYNPNYPEIILSGLSSPGENISKIYLSGR